MGLQSVCQVVEATVIGGLSREAFDIVGDLVPVRMVFLRPSEWRGFVLPLALYHKRVEIYHLKVIAQSVQDRCCCDG